MTKKRLPSRPRTRTMALEPRVLFDGAAAVAGAEHFDGHDYAEQSNVAEKTTTTPAVEATASEPAAGNPTTLLIIDARVADHQSLLADLPANTTVRIINTDESGLGAISEELAKGGNFDAIHIVSHGTPGSLTLGNDTVNNESLSGQSPALQSWAGHLSADADILLYGCDVAQGDAGQALITQLAQLTGADIAASTNATGSAAQGGDWVLESNTGSIETGLVFSDTAMAAYGELMAAPTVTDTAPADEPFSVGENTPKVVGNNITVTGTGTDSLTVTASVTKGTLNASSFTGDAAAVQTWLAALSYTYTGTSQTGDTDTLTLSIVNNTNAGTTPFSRTIAIAPENDAPTLAPPASGAGRLSVAEGGNTAFTAGAGNGTVGSPVTQTNLGLSDLDNTQNQIIIKLTSLPGKGVLKLSGNELSVGSTFAVSDIANLRYHHNGNQVLSTTTDTFQITVDDGAGGLLTLQTVTVDITPVNQTPSVSGNITLIEGETGVSLVGGIVPVLNSARGDMTIGDPDDSTGAHIVTVVSVTSNGMLKYNGTSVINGQVITNANLSLFTYDHNGSETTSDSFVLDVTDAGGGTATPLSSGNTTVNLTIIPNNDDPYWDASTLPDVNNEFGPVVFGPLSGTANLTAILPITQALLHAQDVESGPERITYTLTAIPSGGYLTHSDYAGQSLPVGFSFTQADINAGKISFVSTNGNSHTTDFKFTIMDGDRRLIPNQRDGGIYATEAAGAALTVHTFKIEYQGTATGTGPGVPVPVAQINTPGGSMAIDAGQIAEGQTFTLSATQLSATSTNPAITDEQLTYRLLSLPDNGRILLNGAALGIFGSFTQADVNAGKVKFEHNASENFTSSFTFDVSNGTSTTTSLFGVSTFNIDVKPQNDTPTASNGDEIKLTEGATIVINAGGKTHVGLGDSDNDTSDKITGYALDNVLSFKVTALPTHGTLKLDGTNVTVNQVISKADLDGGKLTYVHDSSENYADTFTIVPLDDKGVGSTSSNTNANTHVPGTDPTNQASEGAPAVINISVNPLNDAPTFKSIAEPGYGSVAALKEGTEFTIGGASSYATSPGYGAGSGTATVPANTVAQLVYEDSDNTSEQRQYRITTATQYGVLTAGGRVLGVGSVFTQAELDSGQVKYKHGGGEQFDDKFEYVVSDGDYGANQNTTNNGTAFAQGTAITPSEYRIKLERSNDKPTISTSHTGLFVIDSSQSGNAKTLPGITLADIDLADGLQTGETNFVQIKVEFLDNTNAAYTNGVLHFTATTGVALIGSNDGSSLTFQGTLADVQAALNQITARTNGTDADLSNLKIKVTVDDRLRDGSGNLSSGANGGVLNQDGTAPNNTFNTASITFTVAASDKNDPPAVVLNATPIKVNEDVRTLINTTITSYTDPDAFDSTSNSITLSVTNGKLYFHNSNNTVTGGATVSGGGVGTITVTLTGTKTQLDTALDNLRYLSNTDYNGNDVLTVTVSDDGKNGLDGNDISGGTTNTGTVAIAILPVNDTPTVTLPGADGYHAITGGSYVFSGGTAISIADAKDFSNFGQPGQQDGQDTNFSVTLNAKLGGADYGTITITTPGGIVSGDGTHTVTLTGSRTAINTALASGVTFTPTAGNLDGTVQFTVTVDDNNNGGTALTDTTTGDTGITGPETASKKLYLQPTDANAPPAFSDLDNTPTFIQNGSAIVLDPNALLSDPELDLFGASGNWNGAILTLQRDGGANVGDEFGFTGSGSTGVNVSGSNVRIGATVIGTLTNTGGTLAITFNTAATAAHVDQVLQAVTYRNTEASPVGSVTINYLIDDQNPNTGGSGTAGSGQDQGTGGKLTNTGSITIGINRQIIAVPDTNAITEDAVPNTVSGDVTPGTTNSNDSGGTQDRDPDLDTIVVQGVKAGTQANVAAVGTAGVGTSVTGTYGTVVINANGSYTYTLDNTNATVNALKPGETLTDVFSYAINDSQGANKTTAFSTLTITVNGANDPPVATDNTNSVTEDTGTPAVGNVRTDNNANGLDSDPDNAIGELSLSGIRTGNEAAGGAMTAITASTSSADGTVIAGQYGTLTIGADGSYSYALNNSNPAVNALQDGQTLSDVFTYTLKDPNNATDIAALTITINGHTDGNPQIVPVDGNVGATGHATVYEKGLTSTADTTETTTGAITVTAPDGIKSVTIGGQVFTVAQLDVLTAGSPSAVIDTGEGELRITGISNKVGAAGAPTSADVSYTYTLKAAITNTLPADTESTDTIALVVTDNSATPKTGTGNLIVQIIDDTPTAVADTNSITKGAASISSNAFTTGPGKDHIGADGAAVGGPVTGVKAGSDTTTAVTTGVATDVTGTYGKIKLNADGTYSYTLDNANSTVVALMGGQTLTDPFTYTITDKDGDTSTTTITITINGVTPSSNAVPVARSDSFTTKSGTPVSDTLKGNDSLGDGSTNQHNWSKTTDPSNGTVVVNSDGTFTYTPNAGFGGTDSFTYTIRDADGDTSTTTVTIVVDGVPVAVNDSATTPPNTPVNGSLKGNDTPSPDGGNVWTKTSDPSKGTATVNPDGTYTYTPNTGFTGTDTFTYTITDTDGDTSTATVTITVGGVPIAKDDSASTPPNTPVNGSLKGNDTPSPDGGNVWTKTTEPSKGTATVNPDGTYTYTPNTGFTGTDTFTYTITDKDGDTSTATVTIKVNNVPVAVNDSFTTKLDNPVGGSLVGNDTPSLDGGNVWSKTSNPSNGTVTVNPDGSFTYTPNTGFTGTDSFLYTITDKDGDQSTATASITVNASTPIAPPPPPPPPPVTPPVAPPIIIPEINNPNPQGNGLVDANRPAPSPILPGERPQLQPEAPLQPRNVLGNSPVILDAGPYFSGERFNDVRRLPLPFHPIVYVNREVVNAQLERAPDDVRVFSQPGMATPGDINLQSQAMGLGMDPNLFVQHSVRDTQRHASFLGSTVDGRLGRVSLSGDWLLPTPELFQPDVDSFLFNPVDKDKDKDKKGQDVAPQGDAENAPQAANEEGAERKASAANDSPAPAKTTARLVSPSFAQQLRNAAGRLPVVSRNI